MERKLQSVSVVVDFIFNSKGNQIKKKVSTKFKIKKKK